MISYANKVIDWPHFFRFFARSRRSPLLMLLLLLPWAGRSLAADSLSLSEYEIKAGFLFNFTRFVEWPESAFATPASPIVICVAGETLLTDLLTGVAVGKVVDGRAVAIRRVNPGDDLHRCNLLFISAAGERRAAEILASVKNNNTLTIGETPGFAQGGGMINFAIQDNKVKLEMNLDAATRAGLKVNSKLIAVSRLVTHGSVAEAN